MRIGALLLAAALPAALAAQNPPTAAAPPPAPAPAQSPPPDAGAILDGAVAAFGRVNTLRADFTQRIRDEMLGTDETSSGELLLQRPDKFAMRWQKPPGNVVVQDGRTLWVYTTEPRQVVRANLTGKPGESPDFMAEFLDQPRQRFAVSYLRSDSVGARPTDVLSLVPRQPGNLPYRRVLVWVDRADSLVRRIEINEGAGGLRRLTFDRVRTNVAVPASTFRYSPPKGVRVIDASQ